MAGARIADIRLDDVGIEATLFEPEAAEGGKRSIGGGRTHRGYSFGRRRR